MTSLTHRAVFTALVVLSIATPASAGASIPADHQLFHSHSRVWDHFTLAALDAGPAANGGGQTSPPRVAAIEYSDAYRTRAKIHKYSSYAMLPLFATELWLGQSEYNTPSDGKRTAHIVVGTGITALFGINTVTGAWNLWEARKDQNGRTRRLIHGLLMMGSDVGFLATWATGPNRYRYYSDWEGARSTHRAIAITSIVTATTGYLIMALGGH